MPTSASSCCPAPASSCLASASAFRVSSRCAAIQRCHSRSAAPAPQEQKAQRHRPEETVCMLVVDALTAWILRTLPHVTHWGDRQTPPQRKSLQLRFFSSFANVAAASTLPCKSGFGAQEPRLDASLRSWTQQSREQTGGNRNCARQTPRRCEFVEDTVAPPQP